MTDQTRECFICTVIDRCRANANHDFVAELPHSWVVLGDAQFYRGYCLLLAKQHVIEQYLMPRNEALALFDEVCSVAESIAAVVHPLKMNYDCLGNAEPHVHWHLFPRFDDDPLKRAPVWRRPDAERKRDLPESDRLELIASIRAEIARRIPSARVAKA